VTGHVVRPGGRRGPTLTVRARAVIVAGGAVQTPALLLRSGLRSASGQLGRNLSVHPNAVVTAFFDRDVTGWQGVHQAFQVREFLAEGLLLTATNLTPPMLAGILPAYGRELGELMADYNRIVTAGPLVSDTGTGRIRPVPGLGPQVFYQLTDHDAARVVRGVERCAEALFTAGATRVLLPFDGAPVVRGPDELRRLLARPVPKRSLQLYSIHLMGTARMSEDPRRGVTGSFGEFHGVPGLIVADASLFPGPDRHQPDGDGHRAGHAQRAAADRATRPLCYLSRPTARRRPGRRARRGSPRRSCSRSGPWTGWSSRRRTGIPGPPGCGDRRGPAAGRCRRR